MVKQEIERVNIDILGSSEIKWIRTGEFNSDDHCICTTVGNNPLEGMKRLSQIRNSAQLWMCLMVKVKSDAVNSNIA